MPGLITEFYVAMPLDKNAHDLPEILLDNVPVTMPELPSRLVVSDVEQVKAAFDPLRGRILQILRDRPATSKQLAVHFHVAPSLMTYHLHILETVGLIQLVAQQLVHGIVAKYYARTAQVFIFRPPLETTGIPPVQLHLLERAREEMLEALPGLGEADLLSAWFPHMRLAPERMQHYQARLTALIDDFLNETPDPDGHVYALFATTFLSPPSLQEITDSSEAANSPDET